MRYRLRCVLALAAAVAALRVAVRADDPLPPPNPNEKPISIVTRVSPREIRNYRVDIDIKQRRTTPGASATELNASIWYMIRHSYGRREGDGPLPLEVSLVEGCITAGGQPLAITPGVYPKLTFLLEPDFSISDVFGAVGFGTSDGMRGVNYGNLIMFFYPLGAEQPRKVGTTWKTQIKIPALKETYDVVNTLRGLETVEGRQAARITQEYNRVPATNMKLTADSLFSLKDGRLLKSHIECEVDVPPDESADVKRVRARADIKIDILDCALQTAH